MKLRGLIKAMEPKLNKQGARWKGVKEFFQDTDDAEKEETALVDIYNKQLVLEEQIKKLTAQLAGIRKL